MFASTFLSPLRAGYAALLSFFLLVPMQAMAQTIPDQILDILDEKCSRCHEGATPKAKLDLTEEFVPANLINQPSHQIPEIALIVPGNPERSYLIQKILGTEGIKGKKMPRKGEQVTAAELEALKSWIRSMEPQSSSAAVQKAEPQPAFPALTTGNLPTAEMLPAKTFLYRVAHRFRGSILDAGFDQLYGFDFGSNVMTELTFPLPGGANLSMKRQSIFATFEVAAKYRLLQQSRENGAPLSLALYAGFDWASTGNLRDPADTGRTMGRFEGERFSWFAQLPASMRFEKVSLLVVPGILVNGNVLIEGEDMLTTLGIAGRLSVNRYLALFGEVVPILSGADTANPVGGVLFDADGRRIFYDTFVLGLELVKGGHVFHVFVTNSGGNTTGQYMSGANFDVFSGDLRFGFNIYRLIDLP